MKYLTQKEEELAKNLERARELLEAINNHYNDENKDLKANVEYNIMWNISQFLNSLK